MAAIVEALATRFRATGERPKVEVCEPAIAALISPELRAQLLGEHGVVDSIQSRAGCDEPGSRFGHGDYRVLRLVSLTLHTGGKANLIVHSRRLGSSQVEQYELQALRNRIGWYVRAIHITRFGEEVT
jgi:hypothetical protein